MSGSAAANLVVLALRWDLRRVRVSVQDWLWRGKLVRWPNHGPSEESLCQHAALKTRCTSYLQHTDALRGFRQAWCGVAIGSGPIAGRLKGERDSGSLGRYALLSGQKRTPAVDGLTSVD